MGVRDEMEARKARRSAIRAEIRLLQGKLSIARELVSAFRKVHMEVKNAQEQWTSNYTAFQSIEINANVLVTDVFEGNIAEKLSGRIPQVTGKMETTVAQMENTDSCITRQITLLEEYIQELFLKIQALYSEMEAL